MSNQKSVYTSAGRDYKEIIHRKLNEFIFDNVDSSTIKMATLPYSWAQERDLIQLCRASSKNPPRIWGWENNPKSLKVARQFAPSDSRVQLVEGNLSRYLQFREPALQMDQLNVLNLDFCSTLNDEVLDALEMLHWHIDPYCRAVPFTITFCLRCKRKISARVARIKKGEGIPELHQNRSSSPQYVGSTLQQMGLVKSHLDKNYGWHYVHVGQETYARPAPGMGVMWGLLEPQSVNG